MKENCKCEVDGLVWTYNVDEEGKASVKGVSLAEGDCIVSAESDGKSKKGFISAEDFFGGGCDDDDDDGKASVDGNLVVPAELDGHPVSRIWDSAFENNEKLKSVSLPTGVVSIGYYAFQGCSGLKTIEIPAGVTEIGEWAFQGCSSLKSIEIPVGVTEIGAQAFNGCSDLKSIEIPASVTEIGNRAFEDCTSLTSVTLPPKLTSIAASLFSGCGKLKSVEIPIGVTEIGEWAFQGCSSLKSIEIPVGVTEIGERAFADCASLTSVTLPPKLNVVSDSLFSGCAKLKSVVLPSAATSIKDEAFAKCAKLKSVEIPASVTEIGECAFKDCASLTSVTLPSNLAVVSESLFSGCSKLKSVVIPPSVTEIKSAAFKGCSSLKLVEIPGDADDIADDAFDGSPAWQCILEKAVVEWQYKVNDDGTATVTGVRPSDEESPGRRVMLEIPAKIDGHDVVEIGASAFERAFEDDDQPNLVFVKVPHGVKRIGYAAFYGLEKLETVEIPDSVTEIGNQAFECSSVKFVALPRGLTRVSRDLFLECTSLRSVEIPDSVTVIEASAFAECSSLEYVEIPPSVTEIQEGAFSESAMTVQLPPDVKFIDENGDSVGIECVFGDCWCVFRTVVKADDGTRMWKWVYDVDSKKATILGVVPSADGIAAPSTICGCEVGNVDSLFEFDTSVGRQLRFYPRRYDDDDLESLREDFEEDEGERFFEELNDCHYDRCDGDPDKWMAVDEDAMSSHKCIRDGFYVDYNACRDGNIHSSWDFYQDGEQIAGYSPCC